MILQSVRPAMVADLVLAIASAVFAEDVAAYHCKRRSDFTIFNGSGAMMMQSNLPTLIARHTTLTKDLAATEAAIRVAEREYWTTRGFSALPRRERLLAALREDAEREAAVLTPLEQWLEDAK